MAKLKEKFTGFLNEFKEFTLRGNVMSMAIGVLIGGAFTGIVTSFTTNIITPVLNCFGKVQEGDVANLAITINGQTIQFGMFIADVINFLIMAFVVFMLLKGMNMLLGLGKKKEDAPEPEPTTKECPFCKSEIPIGATKCAFCTSEMPSTAVANEEDDGIAIEEDIAE